ncbi:hypothetical protein CRUP_002504 [Coryphaenoides rupestris]|nr:hypothetical protein CRUP_002504 [Coryphaenoides rupestris]
MCRCLMGLKVPTTDKPGLTVNFRKLLLNRCQKEFEKDKDDDEIFEKKQKELDAASEGEKQRLKDELEVAKDKARRRSLGNIKFIGELFKLKMLTEVIMHDCIVKLLKNHDEESVECLCRLLSTIGKDLDFEKAKPRMEQYFHQMEKIIKERKTSSRIRFMLQDVLDLRRNLWVPRRGDQGPKTLEQIHKDAEQEEHREQMKVQHTLMSKSSSGPGDRMGSGGGGRGGRGGHHTPGRGSAPQDETWTTVPITTKSRPIDPMRISKISKAPVLDNQVLAPSSDTWGNWGKGSSGGSTSKPADSAPDSGNRPATSTLNRFSALQPASQDADRRGVPQRNSSSRERGDRYERSDRGPGDRDRFERRDTRLPGGKRSFSREKEPRSREREHRGPADPVRRVASMTDDRGSRERARSKENTVAKRPSTPTPPPAQTITKPTLKEEDVEKKSTAIIEEYLHINDIKEALQCVQEMSSTQLLFLFVRIGLESTLVRSTVAREHMGLLLHRLVQNSTIPTQQYYKGLCEILEEAEDMSIDVPHIWLYLAQLIAPMLHEGGIPMGPLFREIAKPLVPLGPAGVLLSHILIILCKAMSHKKVGAMWHEAGLSWKEFLPADQDVNKFVTEKNVEFTLGQQSETGGKGDLSTAELRKNLERLLKDKANNQRILDWVESAIIDESPNKVERNLLSSRAEVLQKYLSSEQKELQALYALQALMCYSSSECPIRAHASVIAALSLLRMFFDALYDDDVIKEEAFEKWGASKDPAEQQGKGVALKSVTTFFTWLREADIESDNS